MSQYSLACAFKKTQAKSRKSGSKIFNEIVSLFELNISAFIIRLAIFFYLYKINRFQKNDGYSLLYIYEKNWFIFREFQSHTHWSSDFGELYHRKYEYG